MRITHLGHACLLVEVADQRLLLDPGNFSSGFQQLTDLDAILVTHQHRDHLDPEPTRALIEANPSAALLLEPSSAASLALPDTAAFAAGETTHLGQLTVTGLGGQHAVNHDQVPTIGNVGFLLTADGEPTLFHPGDMYSEQPEGVDVLALPLSAPWTKMSETLHFLGGVQPRIAVPIHDALLSEAGRGMYLMHASTYGPDETEVRDLSDGEPVDF